MLRGCWVCVWNFDAEVLLEEQGTSGTTDSAPMTLYDLYLMLEKRGVVDFQVTSHDVDRPADVKAGNAADCLDVKHTSYSTQFSRRMWNLPTLAAFWTTRPWRTQSICSWFGASWHLLKIFELTWFLWRHFSFGIILHSFNVMNNLAGMRHYVKEKVLGPAKPLWFVRGDGFTMEANMVYEIAWENNSVQTGGMLKDCTSHLGVFLGTLRVLFGVLSQHTRCFLGLPFIRCNWREMFCTTGLHMVWLYWMLFKSISLKSRLWFGCILSYFAFCLSFSVVGFSQIKIAVWVCPELICILCLLLRHGKSVCQLGSGEICW